MKKPIRIVWLCEFSTDEKLRHLSMWKGDGHGSSGLWIPNLLKAFKNNPCYDIHVITPHAWMRKSYQMWKSDGITYHTFQDLFPIIGSSFRVPINAFFGYKWNRIRMARLIGELKPDLIHLFGFENAKYAATVLDVNPCIPVLCTVQGFISNEIKLANSYDNRQRVKYEQLLMRKLRNFECDGDSENRIRAVNPTANFNRFYFPVNMELIEKAPSVPTRYDVLFAGARSKAKGFPDYLKIVDYCVARSPAFKAAVVGNVDDYPGTLEFVEEHKLMNALDFLGWFPSQDGLFKAYRASRLFLAPTYNDAFPSTIRENMLLGTPCIAYRTGGIPYVNPNGEDEHVVIVPQGDWQAMADRVLDMLRNDELRQEQSQRARTFAEKTFSLESNVAVIKSDYIRLAGGVN